MKGMHLIERTFTLPKTIQITMLAGSMALLGSVAGGCSSTAQAAAPPMAANTPAQNGTTQAKVDPKPIDPATVGAVTGGKPETADKVVKVSFPRNDLPVAIDGWNSVPPFYWGRGSSANLAKTVKQALDLTDWEGKKTGA